MGRTSKRLHALKTAPRESGRERPQETGHYRAGIYARLSSDRDPVKNESVETQIEIAEKYVEEWNRQHSEKIEISGRYADLGKTGTNFDRDAFKRLMQDIRLGAVDCVIVKDLSRFGRNYLEAGNYIEKIFPFLGVRFIAVADGYDTGTDECPAGQIAPEIKNLVNDMYAKDFSVKAKLSLKQRREAGSYVGGPPPYGYEACQEGRTRKLLPDGNTAGIVRMIYQKFVETESCQAVADDLNAMKINPPAVYRKSKEVYCKEGTAYKGWDKSSVERILKSGTYAGRLVQGRTSITAGKEANRIRKPEETWVRRENTHEALVDAETYEQAAEIWRRIREQTNSHGHPAAGCPIGENIFDRVLYCGVCGRKMARHSHVKRCADGRRERKDRYFCPGSAGTKTERCPDSGRISGDALADILLVLLQTEFTARLGNQKSLAEQGQILVRRRTLELEQGLRQTKNRILSLSEEESVKYMAYRMGTLPQEEYARYRLWKDSRMEELDKQIKQCGEAEERLKRKGEIYLKAVRALARLKNRKELTKELVEALIENIHVYPGKRMEVRFTYRDSLTGGVR